MATLTVHKFSKTKSGEIVRLFRFENGTVSVDVLNLGAAVAAVRTPDKSGKLADICLGYSDAAGYEEQDCYFGVVVGRYANRIRGGQFQLNGQAYQLDQNDHGNCLHSGAAGFDKRLWDWETEGDTLILRLESPDGEGGFPGSLRVEVRYRLTDENELVIDYRGVCDQDSILNLTNHSYFNLNGHGRGDILRHQLRISASRFTRVDAEAIPTGELPSVEGTPFDFREFHPVGERIGQEDPDLQAVGGYDHNFVLDGEGLREAACLKESYTGRRLTVYTDLPGIQVYAGNMLKGESGKSGARYGKRSGIALETQYFPDSPNRPEFPSCVKKAGEIYESRTVYRFDVET